MKNLATIIVLSLTLSTLWIPQGTCQFGFNNSKTDKKNKNKKVATMPKIYNPRFLMNPVSIPNVPPYPGKSTYKRGLATLDNPISKTYIMTYEVKDKPDKVINFYQGVLVQPQWKIINSCKQMIAVKGSDGSRVSVQVNPLPNKGGTSYTLTYNSSINPH